MQVPTLSVKNYRSIPIVIRKIGRETFEYLIAMDGMIYCNQVEIKRKAGQRFTKYSEEDTESAVAFMLNTAQDFVDDRLFEKAQKETWLYRWDEFLKKVEDKRFHIKYLLSEQIDGIKEWGKGKRLRRNSRDPE